TDPRLCPPLEPGSIIGWGPFRSDLRKMLGIWLRSAKDPVSASAFRQPSQTSVFPVNKKENRLDPDSLSSAELSTCPHPLLSIRPTAGLSLFQNFPPGRNGFLSRRKRLASGRASADRRQTPICGHK